MVMVGAVAAVGRGLNGSCFAVVQFDVGYNYRGYAVWSRESCSVLAPAAESLALVLPQRRLFAKTCTSSQKSALCSMLPRLREMCNYRKSFRHDWIGYPHLIQAQQVYTPSSIMGGGFF